MVIKKVKIQNFKSIYKELEIDFEEVNGFWRISGNVGAGKTTIGEAIMFGLFGDIRGKSNPTLISWGQKKALVEVWCESKGHEIYIHRVINHQGQSPLDVTIDGEPLVFTNKRDAQLQLEQEFYDISKITLELLCVISFNNFKSLATLNPKESREFLDQVFGFYVLSNYSDICKKFKVESGQNITLTKTKIGGLEKQISKLVELSNMAKIDGDLSSLIEENKRMFDEIAMLKQSNQIIVDEIDSEIKKYNDELIKIKTLGINKKNEIELIKKGFCPTCGAEIDDSQLGIKIEEKAILETQYKDTRSKVSVFTNKKTDEENRLKNEVNKIREKINANNILIGQLKEQEKRNNINTGEIRNLKKELTTENQLLQTQEKDSKEWDMLYGLLTVDIRQKILHSFIPLINESISKYTAQLGLPYIVEFDENFRCNIQLSTFNQDVSLSSLSTGQLKSIDLSIILGILNIILRNVNFNICFLDELFSNMDAELRDIVCKVLKGTIKDGQTVFIISHVELDDFYFDGCIEASLSYMDQNLKESIYKFKKF